MGFNYICFAVFLTFVVYNLKTEVDITAHIRELLFGHDCVILPGFGGFIGNYTPARIDKTTGLFEPPVKKISFNRNLNHNDGLLVKKISLSSGMNYGDARNLVDEYVSDLRKKLEKGEQIVFEHIGTFVNNNEGNTQFEPEGSVNYLPDSYGFDTFRCMPLEGYDVRKLNSGNQIEHYRKHSFRKYLWRAAVLIPLAGIVTVVTLNPELLHRKVEVTTMNPLASAEFEHNKISLDSDLSALQPVNETTANEASSGAAIVADIKPAENPTLPLNEEIMKENVITESSTYLIITGSFQSKENAGNQVGLLQAEGFNPEIIATGNGFFRVCAAECPDLGTAVTKKDSILKKFPGAWISRKK
ncbi:MAG TPA: SPOR domain-containing protein [Bacteroidales bacterium]|nr:SPOR domain-containing protein [Bacteroidales bacterium]